MSLADGFNRDNRGESFPFFKIGNRRQITDAPNASPYRATMSIVECLKETLFVSLGKVGLDMVVEIRRYGMVGLFRVSV